MANYFYVDIANSRIYRNNAGNLAATETGNLLKNVSTSISLGYYEPSVAALPRVKLTEKKRQSKFLGISYTEKYSEYDPFFIICENNKDFLEDVITGRKYIKQPNTNSNNVNSDKLVLRTISQIPTSRVAELLKSLSKDDVERYRARLLELEKAIRIGYQRDIERLNKEKRQTQNNEEYIKNFKNRYGKSNIS